MKGKQISVRIDKDLLEKKMQIAGYESISQFIRDLVKDYNSNPLDKEIEMIRKELNKIQDLLSYKKLHSSDEIRKEKLKAPKKPEKLKSPPKKIPKKPIQMKQKKPKSKLPNIPNPNNKGNSNKLAYEIEEIKAKLGNIHAILNSPPEEEMRELTLNRLKRMGIDINKKLTHSQRKQLEDMNIDIEKLKSEG